MQASIHHRTIALAAIFQAIQAVDLIARTGMAEVATIETSIHSIFQIDATDIAAVFGGLEGLHSGLACLNRQLCGVRGQPVPLLTGYLLRIFHLERRLQTEAAVIAELQEGIRTIAREQDPTRGLLRTELVTALAELYQATISPLGPRILVRGDPTHLNNANNAARIRALLLAGIRAAVLCRQAGGGRWLLLFKRQAMCKEAKRILASSALPTAGHNLQR